MAYFTTPEQIMDHLHDLISQNAGELGVNFVGYGDERLKPGYPAILITGGPVAREIHGTHTFLLRFLLELWVYHANLDASHQVRTREDLQLVSRLRALLHNHHRLFSSDNEAQVIFSYVSAEDPAFVRRPESPAVVASRVEWTAESREIFGSS
jgi:hypothetical protein